jgi:SAM-dependent methyltransferase
LEPNQFVVQYLESLPPGNMVDLAGGEGRNALWFAKRGWSVENVEISKVALDKFMQRAQRDETTSKCIATHADALSAKFALDANLLVIAYMQLTNHDLRIALSNAVSQLAEGSEVFGVWHAKRNLTEGFGGPPMAEVLPTVEELEAWASQELESVEVFEVNREVQKDGVTHVAIDVILRGKVRKSQ